MEAQPHTTLAPPLLLSRLDCERIEALLDSPNAAGIDTTALRGELARATLAESADMPADVVTMNSVVRMVDDAGAERELALVYPRDAGAPDRVSILAPVGTALLGLRAGDAIDWPLPGGSTTRLRVLAVRYQPAAAGELHR